MKHITHLAFAGCTKLQHITLPIAMVELENDAFDDCDSLSNIFYCGSEEEFSALNFTANADLVYYYSEQVPESRGRFWHYVDGVETVW